jgi:hypothetical protein
MISLIAVIVLLASLAAVAEWARNDSMHSRHRSGNAEGPLPLEGNGPSGVASRSGH